MDKPKPTTPQINLKPEFADQVIGFNNDSKPLGQRNDLDKLIILAHQGNRQDYLAMFDNPPSLEELKGKDVDAAMKAVTGTPLPDQAHATALQTSSSVPGTPGTSTNTNP